MVEKTTKNKKSTVKKRTNTSSSVKRKSIKKTTSKKQISFQGKKKGVLSKVIDKIKNMDKAKVAGRAIQAAYGLYLLNKVAKNFPIFDNILGKIKTTSVKYLPISTKILGDIYPNEYTFVKTLGAGAYGNVSLVRENKTGELVVAKKASIKYDSPSFNIIKGELKILDYLKKKGCNKFIVCYKKYTVYDDYIYILQDYHPDFLSINNIKIKELDKNIVEKIIYNICEGIKYLHYNNICHLDVKLDNILFNQATGDIKYIDFGVSCLNECNVFSAGTPGYMSPEMVNRINLQVQSPLNIKLGKDSDVYGVCITIKNIIAQRPEGEFKEIIDIVYKNVINKKYPERVTIHKLFNLLGQSSELSYAVKTTRWWSFDLF